MATVINPILTAPSSGGGGQDLTGLVDGTSGELHLDLSDAGDTGGVRAYAFRGCSALTSLTLPPGLTGSIGTYAFLGCSALTSLTLPPGLTGSIGTYAFNGCSSLTSLTLPPGLTGSIGTYAFAHCSSLTSLTLQSPTMQTLIDTNAFTSTTCLIYVPADLVDAYKAATNWSTLADRIHPIPEE